MADSERSAGKELTMGDAAVDGLLAGGGAGVLMAGYLVAVGLLRGEAIASILGRFDPGQAPSPLVGLLVHLAVAGVYGAVFGWIRWALLHFRPFERLPGWLAGAGYGLALLVVAQAVLLPGSGSPLRQLPFVHWTLAHLIYGVTLGIVISRPVMRK